MNNDSKFVADNGKGKKLTVKLSYLLKKDNSIVDKLNKAGFSLGSGHDGISWTFVDENEVRIDLMTYQGAPTQCVRFKREK